MVISAAHERVEAQIRPLSEHQAVTGEEQEAAGDQPGEDLPAAGAGGSRGNIAEELEIPDEVIGCHGEQRHAARDIDEGKSPPCGRLSRYLCCR